MRVTIYGRSYESLDEVQAAIAELSEAAEGRRFTEQEADLWNHLNEAAERFEQQLRRDRLEEIARSDDPRFQEREEPGDRTAHRPRGEPTAPERSRALALVDQHTRSGLHDAPAADRLDGLVRKRGPAGDLAARYMTAVGDPAYLEAFGRVLQDPASALLRMTPAEQRAWAAVQEVEHERATMAIGTGPTGGYAVPYTLDPSIMLTDDGALNPVRRFARSVSTVTNQWRGVTSAGAEASYDEELEEASDDAPTLGEVIIDCHRVVSFIPFSIEVGGDWGSLQAELGRLMIDAVDQLDSAKFLEGDASGTAPEPEGILNGLSTTQRVQTDATGTLALGDVWALKAALPPRFVGNATFLAAPAILDTIYRFVGGGSTEPPVMPTRGGEVAGLRQGEWSAMDATTTSGDVVAIVGDLRNYVIVDRLGWQVELISHLLGSNRRPIGARGLYGIGRRGAKIAVPEAFRYAEVL
jgi:HK97 family phage major capsid protein